MFAYTEHTMVWTDVVLEAYCMAKSKKNCMKRKSTPEEKDDGIEDPVAKKLIPEYWCLAVGCPFFAHCNADEKVYLWLNKFYEK